MGWLTRTPWHWSIAENVYFPLNLPEGTVQGPLSFSGENVNFRWRYCLTIFGTLHHQGSMKGLRNDLQTKNKVRSASTFYSSIVSEVNETIVTWDHRQGRDKHRILWRSRPTEWRPSVLSADPCWSRVRPGRINDLTIGWQNVNPMSPRNATLTPQARQARVKYWFTCWVARLISW